MVHQSTRYNHGMVRMGFCDVLKECPQWHWWPWCSCCRKFLFPPEDHRRSNDHNRRLGWYSQCPDYDAGVAMAQQYWGRNLPLG